MLIDWWVTDLTKRIGKILRILEPYCTLLLFLKFHYVKLEAILKRLQ